MSGEGRAGVATCQGRRRRGRAVVGLRSAALVLACVALVGCGETGSCGSDADCAFLNPGDPCLGSYACVDDRCALDPATVVTCDASGDSPCEANLCQPDTGSCALTPRNEGAPCDDGEPCSSGDACKAGACVSGATQVCDCAQDADCTDDGDLCNGTPRCDTSAFPARCVVAPETVVSCTAATDACQVAACDPKSGKCTTSPKQDGATCDDGDACTAGDVCAKGACKGVTDTCSCETTSDCVDPDNNPCNGVPYCDKAGGKGVCKPNPATVVSCSTKADTACAKSQCNPASGTCQLAAVADDQACDDGDPCTKGEVCVAGTCAAGTDVCKCTSDGDCKGKDDGDLCNGTLFCNKQSGSCEVNPATVVTCATVGDTDCAKNVCDPAKGTCGVLPRSAVKLVGCVDVNLGGLVGKQCLWAKAATPGAGPFACDDGSVCTVGDACKGATCAAGKTTCECAADSDCADKDDGDACNGVPFCDKSTGSCKPNPASVVYCDKSLDADCLKAQCDPKTGKCGLQPVKAGAACDDGKVCTTGDSCTALGACVGQATSCDDGAPCTQDACSPTLGCTHTKVVCDDGNECTTEACDQATGKCKVPSPVGTSVQCEADGNGCTVADHCDGKGSCVAGASVSCDAPKAACQVAVCKSVSTSKFECVVTAAKSGTPCDDGDPCFVGSVCAKGGCVKGTTSTLWTKKLTTTPAVSETRGALVRSEGSVTLLRTTVGGTNAQWTVYGLTVDKQQLYPELKMKGKNNNTFGPAVALVGLGSDASAVVGPQRVTKKWGTTFAVVSATGKLTQLVHASDGADASPLAAARHVSGNLLVVEHSTAPSAGHRVRLVGINGQALWTYAVDKRSAPAPSARLLTTPSGGVFAYLVTVAGKVLSDRAVLHLSGSGKKIWEIDRAYPDHPVHVAGLANLAAGRFHALTTEAKVGTYWGSWDAESAAPTQTNRYLAKDFLPADAVAYGGGLFAVGSDGTGQAVARYDALGNRQWLRTIAVPPTIHLRHVRVDAARERLVLVGQISANGGNLNAVPVVITTSLRADATCAARGVCASKPWGACDDNNACTADTCSPLVGCVHSPPASALCPLTTGCSAFGQCGAGACQEPTYGRLFAADTSALVPADYESKGRFTLSPDKDVAHAWSEETSKTGLALHAYKASLTSGALAFGGPPIINCLGMDRIDGLRRRPDGTVLALGRAKGTKGAAVAAICQASPGWTDGDPGATVEGKVTLIQAPNCTSCPLDARGIALHSNGDVMIAINSTYSGGTGQLWRLNKDLKVLFGQSSNGSEPYGFNGVTSTALGDAVGVGYAGKTGSSKRPLFVRRTSQGVLANSVVITALLGGSLFDIEPTKSGDLVAVGTVVHSNAARSSLALGLSTAGKVLWTHLPALPDQGLLKAVFALDDGYVAAGSQIVGGPEQLFMTRRTNQGVLLWSRSHGLAGSKSLDITRGSLLRTTLGTYVMGARLGSKPKVPMWIHASRHGFVSCAAAGKCTSPKTTCDDQNPCTADWCDPVDGCSNTPLSGLACGTKGTCNKGKCQ